MAFDVSPLLKGMETAQKKQLAAAVRAVDVFAEQVVGDAQQLCPVATGALQGSGVVGRTAQEVAALVPIQETPTKISKEIGFNTDYAAAVHENLTSHHDMGGPKFLETALRENAPKLGPFIADAIAEVKS